MIGKIRLAGMLAMFALTANAQDNHELLDFVQGNYLLVGKAVNSNDTYTGKVEIYAEKDKLVVKRIIKGKTVYGQAAIESAAAGDAQVLRMRFTENNKAYETTCLINGDLDNYARISCYVYEPNLKTDNPGLETLFHDHTAQ